MVSALLLTLSRRFSEFASPIHFTQECKVNKSLGLQLDFKGTVPGKLNLNSAEPRSDALFGNIYWQWQLLFQSFHFKF
jgi:hypothetical protein